MSHKAIVIMIVMSAHVVWVHPPPLPELTAPAQARTNPAQDGNSTLLRWSRDHRTATRAEQGPEMQNLYRVF